MDRNNLKTRPPTPEELEEIAQLEWKTMGSKRNQEELDDQRATVKTSYVTVFEDFASEGPGYIGPLIVVVWGCPTMVSTYCRHHEGYLYREEMLASPYAS
jgi:hypothetical protein